MKKTFLLLLSFLSLCFFSYAKITLKSDLPSKITENSEIVIDEEKLKTTESLETSNIIYPELNPNEPVFSYGTTLVLDSLWSRYFTEKNDKYLDFIFEHIECENLLEQFINNNFALISKDERIMNHLSSFCEISDSGVDFLVDYELISGILLKYSDAAEEIKYLYSQIPSDFYIRGIMRSTALWSFLSNSYQDNNVNLYLEKKYFSISEEIFYAINCIYKTNNYPVYISDNGYKYFKIEKQYSFHIGLVKNIQTLVKLWNDPSKKNARSFQSTTILTTKTTIAPFIMYQRIGEAEFPLFYDIEIIDQYGNIFTDKIKNLRLAEKSPDLYQSDCVVDYFEFALTKDDVPGPYTFRIFIHTGKKVIAAVELPFNFNRG
ncbi:MAG: hypothetical protein IKI98_03300 [Spirochaetaceae bacterium]|nr:hypothetical protein [Spirochaetaceae bacterium]